jgi:hypothetical protein
MKNIVTLLISVLLLAACAAPKYTYYFDHYDYNSGKRKAIQEKALLAVDPSSATNESDVTPEHPLMLSKETLTATAGDNVPPLKNAAGPTLEKEVIEKKYTDMTKTEKKEFRKMLKTEVKKYVKAKKSGEDIKAIADTKAMDYNLKMAIIFGAVAVTLSFFGGVNSVFWIVSVVSLVVGVVFFIKWIAEQ